MLSKLVGYLTHPHADLPQEFRNIELTELQMSKMFLLLQSNKVLLRTLNFEDLQKFPRKSRFLSKALSRYGAFRSSYEHRLSLQRYLLSIITKLNEQSISSMVIKSLNDLPLDSDNFDILVMEKDLPALFKVLRELDFVRREWYNEPYKCLFEKAVGVPSKQSYAVHVHTAIAWGGMKFVDVKSLWTKHREKEIDGVMVHFPMPEHHLLTTMAHAFFENLEFRLGDLACIIEDIQDDNIDWNYILNWVVRNRWFDSFYTLLRLADHIYTETFGDKLIPDETLELLANKGKKRNGLIDKLVRQFDEKSLLPVKIPIVPVALQTVKKILTAPSTPFLEKARMILYLLNSFTRRKIPIYRRHPAFLICFIGQDGTGKTTHARYVWTNLKQIDEKFQVEYLWSRGFGYSFQPFLVMIRRLLLGYRPRHTRQSSDSNKLTSLLKREPLKSLWAYIMLVDHLIHLAKVRVALFLGHVVICDRWISDTLIDVKCDLGKTLNRFVEKTLERLLPKPERTFLLDAETGELAKRRPEIERNLLECKRRLYLANSKGKGFKVISTHEDLEKNKQMILSTVIKGFFSQSY